MTPPAYLHIANTLLERLAKGVYGSGSRLPSESQLCAEFGVSHMTLRRALAMLTDRGLICSERGRGTFVRSFDLSDSVFTLKQLTGEWLDGTLEVRLLSAATIRANKRVAKMLAVPRGDRVVCLRRLLLRNETPAIYHMEYMPYDPHRPLVELVRPATSFYGLLPDTTGDERFPRGEITLRASALGIAAARVLDEPTGAPALCIEHLFQDAALRPLRWGCLLLRADLFTLQTYLGPERRAAKDAEPRGLCPLRKPSAASAPPQVASTA